MSVYILDLLTEIYYSLVAHVDMNYFVFHVLSQTEHLSSSSPSPSLNAWTKPTAKDPRHRLRPHQIVHKETLRSWEISKRHNAECLEFNLLISDLEAMGNRGRPNRLAPQICNSKDQTWDP